MKCTKNYILTFDVRGRAECCQISIYNPDAPKDVSGKTVVLVTERTYPCLTLYPTIAALVWEKEGYDWPDEIEWYYDCATQERVDTPTLWIMNMRPVPSGWLWREIRWVEDGLSAATSDEDRARFFCRLDSADPLALIKAAAPWTTGGLARSVW